VANAAWTWRGAAKAGATVVLRIEDHDRGRCRPEYEARILSDLEWLGLEPEPESWASLRSGGRSPWRQSDCFALYQAALDQLAAQGLVYGCTCTRSTIARELGDGLVEGRELRYPGTCREKGIQPGPGTGMRIRLPETEESFEDLRLGPQRQRPQEQCGDLLARDRNGNWTYQFAVTVDDLRHGIDLVVRGEDLLSSTGRQLALARLLGRTAMPRFLHHPLIRTEAGEKLNKRDRPMTLSELRRSGVTASEVIERARRLSGLAVSGER
jgi:glutamyl-tRNA synthetase/glutamyl-Q tRNA(Asp) synthetase